MGNRQVRQLREDLHSNAESVRNLALVLRQVNADLATTKSMLEETRSNFEDNKAQLLEKIHQQNAALKSIDTAVKGLDKKSATRQDLTKLMKVISDAKEEFQIDKSKIPEIVQGTIDTDRKNWDDTVLQMQERYQETKEDIRKAVSLDLEHERGLHDLKKQCDCITNKRISEKQERPWNDGEIAVHDDYRLAFSKVSLLMKQLKEDMNIKFD